MLTYIDCAVISGSSVPDGKDHPSPKDFKVKIGFFLSSSVHYRILVDILVVYILKLSLDCPYYLPAQERMQIDMPKMSKQHYKEFEANLQKISGRKNRFQGRSISL